MCHVRKMETRMIGKTDENCQRTTEYNTTKSHNVYNVLCVLRSALGAIKHGIANKIITFKKNICFVICYQ